MIASGLKSLNFPWGDFSAHQPSSRHTMDEQASKRSAVDRFLLEEIDSVPHLEALLLLWNSRPRLWSLEEMAHDLYLSPEQTQPIIRDLAQRHFIVMESEHFRYIPDQARDALIASLDDIYRREIVRISTIIHSKPSASVRAFARAFKLTKD